MNIEQILSLPLAETFLIDGIAADVNSAHVMAQNGLRSLLGADPPEAWNLKVMTHAWATPESIKFHAEFVRTPNYEAE